MYLSHKPELQVRRRLLLLRSSQAAIHTTLKTCKAESWTPTLDFPGVILRQPPLDTQISRDKRQSFGLVSCREHREPCTAPWRQLLSHNPKSQARVFRHTGTIPREEVGCLERCKCILPPNILKDQDISCLTSPCWGCSLPTHSPSHTSPGPASPPWDAKEPSR